MKKVLKFNVNGKDYEILISPNKTLLEVLREGLFLTGTKHGCDTGECGLCTVLIDGIPHLSCLTLAITCEGKNITTVEGIDKEEVELIEKSFLEEGAVQCGFCTPSFVIMAKYLMDKKKKGLNHIDLKEELSGNLCRCTGYKKIIKAFERILG